MTIDDIRADFALLDDWEDRYRYVIELGRALPPLPEDLRTEANKVRGCASLPAIMVCCEKPSRSAWRRSASVIGARAIIVRRSSRIRRDQAASIISASV